MHPTATTALISPSSFMRRASRIVSIVSSLAAWMKPQVLMITTSAPVGSLETRAPCATSAAIMRSESTVFLSQPRVTTATRGPPYGPIGSMSRWIAWTSRATPGRTGSGERGKTGRSRRLVGAVTAVSPRDDLRSGRRREAEHVGAKRGVGLDRAQRDRAHRAVLLADHDLADVRPLRIDPQLGGPVGGRPERREHDVIDRAAVESHPPLELRPVLGARRVQELRVEVDAPWAAGQRRAQHLLGVGAGLVDPEPAAVRDH